MSEIRKFQLYPCEYRSIAALSGVFSLRMLGLFMILPVFAIYAQQLQGVTPTLMGLALGIYGLSQALFQIPFGFISDRIGRKPMIIIGLLLFFLGSMVAALSDSIWGIIIGRSLQGSGAIGSVVMALLSDLTRTEIRLRAMAFIGISIGISFGLAFILGPLLTAQWGLSGIFWLTAILALLGIVVLQYCVPTPDKQTNSIYQKISMRWFKPRLSILYFGVLVLHASLTALFLKIPAVVQSLAFSEGQAWQFYVPVFLTALILTVPVITLIEKINNRKTVLGTLVIALLLSELFLFNPLPTPLGLGVSLCFFFIAFNSLEASLPAYISKSAPEGEKGVVLGIFSTMQFLGLFFGGVIGGLLDAWAGDLAVICFCVILALVWLVWIFRLNHS